MFEVHNRSLFKTLQSLGKPKTLREIKGLDDAIEAAKAAVVG